MLSAYSSTTNKLADYTYDAWGETQSENETSSFRNNPLRYCGEYYDYESGMTYLRARYYDSNIKRFITEDPHWNIKNMIYGDSEGNMPDMSSIIQSSNLYGYAMNNPIIFVDPSDLSDAPLSIFGLIFGQSSNDYVKDLKLKGSKISDVGCEVVAIHNVLYLKDGKGADFNSVLDACEKITINSFAGNFGCNPHGIGKVLEKFSVQYTSAKILYDAHKLIRDNRNYIISFWNKSNSWLGYGNGLHTVAFTVNGDGTVTAYNVLDNQSYFRYYDSYSDFEDNIMIDKNKFIKLYRIE